VRELAALQPGHGAAFRDAKFATARFYFQRVLPRVQAHAAAVKAGGLSLMALTEEAF
jgi:hypothetical protein